MAYSILTYTGDGSTTDFLFDKPYIAQSDVVAYVDDVLTAITYPDSTHVRFSPAPANGADIKVKRVTNVAVATYLFPDPTYLKSENLDGDFLQQLYLHQEVLDELELLQIEIDAVPYVRKDGDIMTGTLSMGDGTSRSRIRFDEGNYGTQLIFRNNSLVPIAQFHRETGYEDNLQLQTFNASTSAQETTVEFGQGQIALSGTLAADPTHDNHLTRESYVKKHLLLDGSRNMTGTLQVSGGSSYEPEIVLRPIINSHTSQFISKDSNGFERANWLFDDSTDESSWQLRNSGGSVISTVTNQADGNLRVTAAVPNGVDDLTRKDYVDDSTVSITGDTMTGNLNIEGNSLKMFSSTYNAGASLYTNQNDLVKIDLYDGAGTWANTAFTMSPSTGNVNFGNYVSMNGGANFSLTPTVTAAAPTIDSHLTRKDYVDDNFLALAGGTLTGTLKVGDGTNGVALILKDKTTNDGYPSVFLNDGAGNVRYKMFYDGGSGDTQHLVQNAAAAATNKLILRADGTLRGFGTAPAHADDLTNKAYVDADNYTTLIATDDLNSLSDGRYSWAGASPINVPTPASGDTTYGLLHQTDNGGQPVQFAYSGKGGSVGGWMATRRKDAGTWSTWKHFTAEDYVDLVRPMTMTIVATTGAISNQPTGWTCTRTGTGSYTVTHNLGLALSEYAGSLVHVCSSGVVPIVGTRNTATANTFQYRVYDMVGTLVDINHNLTFQIGDLNT